MKPSALTINTGQFTGSVQLLVNLVQQQKLTNADVDLPAVVSQYAKYVRDCLVINCQLTSFTSELPLLGWLVERWSCQLLPAIPRPATPVDQVYEARIKQILDYRRFQVLARSLKTAHDFGRRLLGAMHPFLVPSASQTPTPSKQPLTVDDEQFLQAWRDIADKIRYSNISDLNVVHMRWSPAQFKAKIMSFLQQNPRQQWQLLSFLLRFAFNLTTLLCVFLLVLELIYHGQLKLTRVNNEWTLTSINF